MIISAPNLALFFSSLETRFWTAYSVSEVVSTKLVTQFPVNTEQFASGWMGQLDKMKEWTGPRVVRQPALQTYIVPIKPFELTEQVDQFKLEDDTYGMYYPLVSFMGESAKKWPDYELRDLIQNRGSWTGAAQKGLDGLSHWSAVHPVDYYDAGKGTYCNDFRGGVAVDGITVGGALGVTSYSTLWQEFASRKGENGETMGLMPDLAVHAAQLKLTMDTILQASFFGAPTIGNLTGNTGSTENMLKGWTDRLLWSDLSAHPLDWMMLQTNKAIKPFSWLLRQAPQFVTRTSPQDPSVFDTHTYLYGSTARGAPAWSFAWLSAMSGPMP